jgi:CRISPR-associated Cas5-like protein
MLMKPYPIQLEISGPTALWTRPDTGSSPVSYVAPTFSAVKGIFEAVLRWKSVNVRPTKVEICAPVQFHRYTTHYGGPLRASDEFPSSHWMGKRWRSGMRCPRPEAHVCEIAHPELPAMSKILLNQMQ